MMRKLFALSTVFATVVAVSSVAEAGRCCRQKRSRRCCRPVCCQYAAPCGVCATPAAPAAPAVEAPATEAAPEPPPEAK
jgi:hypothetical protein